MTANLAIACALGLTWVAAATAQVARLETHFEPNVGFQPGRPLIARGSAVVIAPGRAVTCSHAVQHHELHLREVRVGGIPVEVQLVSADLALLTWTGAPPATDAPFEPVVHRTVPADGTPVVHRWYDHASRSFRRRPATWSRRSAIREGFRPGMSGSGVFTEDGELLGIALQAGGLVAGPLDLGDLLRHAFPGSLLSTEAPR